MTEWPNEYGGRVKKVLKEKALTMKWLADQLGVKPQTVRTWLGSSNSTPVIYRKRISEILTVDFDLVAESPPKHGRRKRGKNVKDERKAKSAVDAVHAAYEKARQNSIHISDSWNSVIGILQSDFDSAFYVYLGSYANPIEMSLIDELHHSELVFETISALAAAVTKGMYVVHLRCLDINDGDQEFGEDAKARYGEMRSHICDAILTQTGEGDASNSNFHKIWEKVKFNMCQLYFPSGLGLLSPWIGHGFLHVTHGNEHAAISFMRLPGAHRGGLILPDVGRFYRSLASDMGRCLARVNYGSNTNEIVARDEFNTATKNILDNVGHGIVRFAGMT